MLNDYYYILTLQKKAQTINDFGGTVETWSDDSTFQGLINQATSKDLRLADQWQIKATHKLYCDISVNINSGDRVKRGTVIYRVSSEPKNTVDRDHHYKIFLERIDTDG